MGNWWRFWRREPRFAPFPDDLEIEELRATTAKIDASFIDTKGEIVRILASEFYRVLAEHGAANYLEVGVTPRADTGLPAMTVTIQVRGRITPGRKAAMACDHLRALIALDPNTPEAARADAWLRYVETVHGETLTHLEATRDS